MQPIVEVNHIYKKYKIGESQPYYTLRDAITNLATNFFKKKRDSLESDEFWALKNISFQVLPGEVVGIIGKNGAGKSTLLKILSRITPPTKGEAILRGRVASLLEVGTGFQPELTGRENIYLNGVLLGMKQSEIKTKLDEIVAFADVEKFLDMPVKHYSSGMYVRLGFAIAAHLDSEILIIDEVLAVGDAEFQQKCIRKIKQVQNEGRTILFVSHNIDSVKALCKRCLYIKKGSIMADGKTNRIIQAYLNNI